MKKLTWVLLLLFLLGLAGCKQGRIDEEYTEPEQNEETTEATTEETEPEAEISELEDAELREFEEMFSLMTAFGTDNWWYNMALTSQYAAPEELDLYSYFYNGFRDAEVSQEERDRLEALGMWMELDIQKNPVADMDVTLQRYFGLSLEQMQGVGLDGMIYLEETDSYYKCCGDVSCMEYVQFHKGYRDAEGVVSLYYMNFIDEEWVVTLKPAPEGAQLEYHMVSNMPAE